MEECMFWINVLLASSVLAAIVGGLLNRKMKNKGIGWQFIRYTVICISVSVVALLALNDSLSGEAATILAGALGYAFGHQENPGSDGD